MTNLTCCVDNRDTLRWKKRRAIPDFSTRQKLTFCMVLIRFSCNMTDC